MRRIPSFAIAVILLPFITPDPRVLPDPGGATPVTASVPANAIPGGELRPAPGEGEVQAFPLKHTEVRAEITGSVAQVRVNQVFQNPYDRPIEAVYVFPLPRTAAVDDMEIRLDDRVIRGVIMRREEARALYQAARRSGRTAALLDQERPNIFTQSVANILPGEEVVVSIRFFDVLPYDAGFYEFTFPMVVGPRFIPGAPVGEGERGLANDTTDVPDASRITPPALYPGERSGHDVSLEVQVRASALLHDLASPSHAVDVENGAPGSARVVLKQEDSIPNRDFILRYRLDGALPEVVLLPHRTEGPGYFLLILQPEVRPAHARIAPKEIIFVVDCSGSMSDLPIGKVREAMRYALENLNPLDNFQIIRFSDEVDAFAPGPVPATPDYIARALEYVDDLEGGGGTVMMEAVKAALSVPEDPQRLRIISFMTDGYIGNEDQVLAYLKARLGEARLFSFGVGTSPNRYLLDKMAEFGRGSVHYVLLDGKADESVQDFYDKIRNPYMTDIEIDWGDLRVSEIYPARIPDLYLGRPVVLFGRYEEAGAGEIVVRGRLGAELYERHLRIELPERQEGGEAIESLWARSKIEELSDRLLGNPQPDVVEEITGLALAHRLVSARTSFVAVEEIPRTAEEEPLSVEVPVPVPAGVSYEGIFGIPVQEEYDETLATVAQPGAANASSTVVSTSFSSPFISGLPVPGSNYQEVLVLAPGAANASSASQTTSGAHEFISGLPVLGVDYQDVLVLAPGVTDVSSSGSPDIHGAPDTDVVTLVDGASAGEPAAVESGGNLTVETIEDIEVITSGGGAVYGRAQGAFSGIVQGSGGRPGESEGIRRAPFSPVFCRLDALRKSYRVGEKIEIYVAIKNQSRKTVRVPASLSVPEGMALIRIMDAEWNVLPPPDAAGGSVKKRALLPGEWIVFKVTLNGKGGYQLKDPGQYHLVFMGSELGLSDSTRLTLRIGP
jgi:Ca-activated chloride channel family protein